MYKIFWADLGKATDKKEIGTRPVVSVEVRGNQVKVYEITCRNRQDKYHARMNNYLISGYCNCDKAFWIDKKYLKHYVRDCTMQEHNNISEKIKELIKDKAS